VFVGTPDKSPPNTRTSLRAQRRASLHRLGPRGNVAGSSEAVCRGRHHVAGLLDIRDDRDRRCRAASARYDCSQAELTKRILHAGEKDWAVLSPLCARRTDWVCDRRRGRARAAQPSRPWGAMPDRPVPLSSTSTACVNSRSVRRRISRSPTTLPSPLNNADRASASP
jgi:hypothetical protein